VTTASARYFDPTTDAAVTVEAVTADTVDTLVQTILAKRSDRGHPAIEVARNGGASMSLGTDGNRACLVWVNGLGESFHSVGEGDGQPLVYDYFGSWTEAPDDWTVPLAEAVRCIQTFTATGTAATESVLFAPD
jgi:hypothetical protein